MTLSVTITFDNEAAMLSFFSGKSAAPAPAPKATEDAAAPSPRTAEPTPPAEDAAPETKALDFDKDVVPALKSLSTKDKAKFGKMMGDLGCKNVNDVKGKPDTWATIVAAAA